MCYAQTMHLSRRALLGGRDTLPLARVARGEPTHRLTLPHLNDFHSRHDAVNVGTLSRDSGDGCFDGAARLATAICAQTALIRR